MFQRGWLVLQIVFVVIMMFALGGQGYAQDVLPSQTPTPTMTNSPSPSPSPSQTNTPTATYTQTATATFTPTDTASPTITPSLTPTPTYTITPSATATATETTSVTPSSSPSASVSPSALPLASATPSATMTPSVTLTPSITPTASAEGWTSYNDNAAILAYDAGVWESVLVTEAYGESLSYTTTQGAQVAITFTGTGIQVDYARGPEGQGFNGVLYDVEGNQRQLGYWDNQAFSYRYQNLAGFVDLPYGTYTLVLANGMGALWLEGVHIQTVAGTTLRESEPVALSQSFAAPQAFGFSESTPQTVVVNNEASFLEALGIANQSCNGETIIDIQTTVLNLTAVESDYAGATGTPRIDCQITIQGNGTTIKRVSGSPRFRLFSVFDSSTAHLTLNDVTLEGGAASLVGGSAVFVWGAGRVTLDDVTVINNVVDFTTGAQTIGAGLYSFLGTITVSNSVFDNNHNYVLPDGDGGAIGAIGGSVTVTNSTFTNNSAYKRGGAIWVDGAASVTQSHIEGNTSTTEGSSVSGGVNAPNNWWGAVDGPSGFGIGSGDAITSNVTYIPFLTSSPISNDSDGDGLTDDG